MRWGERSCTKFGKSCEIASEKTCNVDCIDYKSNGNYPDSISKIEKLKKEKSTLQQKDINLTRSKSEKFDKNLEFVVLKKHLFYMQSISPKKIILKFKRKLKKHNHLPDGIFSFVENDLPIEFKQVFKKLDAQEEAKQKIIDEQKAESKKQK